MLLLLFLCLLSILIHEKTKVLREENENVSHIRKRETILSKQENIELRASDKAKEESIPNTATKKLNRTHEIERGTNKLRTLATESSTGPSNKAFKNTRPKPAYGRQGLDWMVGPGYSFVVFSTNKTMETNQKP